MKLRLVFDHDGFLIYDGNPDLEWGRNVVTGSCWIDILFHTKREIRRLVRDINKYYETNNN